MADVEKLELTQIAAYDPIAPLPRENVYVTVVVPDQGPIMIGLPPDIGVAFMSGQEVRIRFQRTEAGIAVSTELNTQRHQA